MGWGGYIMRRDETRQRGAALVELALLLPLLLMLLLGIVSVGLAYNHQISLTHAARESGRFAATLPVSNFGSLEAWLDAVSAQTVENATGSLDPSTPGLVICVAYVHPNGTLATDSTASRVDTAGVVTYPNAPCFPDGRPSTERRVQVRVERDIDFDVVAFSRTVTLQSDAVSRFESALGS